MYVCVCVVSVCVYISKQARKLVCFYTCTFVYACSKIQLFLGGEGTNRLCTAPVAGGLLVGLKSPSVPGVVPGKSIPSRGSTCSH